MSEFTSQGGEHFPNGYVDRKRMTTIAEMRNGEYIMTNQRLEDMLDEYARFLQRPDVMPRAKAQAEQIVNHLVHELCYRDGQFDVYIGKIEDETCLSV